MSAWRRIGIGTIALLTVSLSLTSCSLDPTSNPAGPSKTFDRREHGPLMTLNPQGCNVSANDIFGDGGALPFVLSCEDMNEAEVTESTESYNLQGCMVRVAGEVYFPSTGHLYSYMATTSDCRHDGGTLKICASHWGGCTMVPLPNLTIMDVDNLPAPSK